jgi:hypothetical protein
LDNIQIIISIFGVVVTLSSIFVHIHKRLKIPKLSFDGYFKYDQEFISQNVPTKVTNYCVKIKDMNNKSEGKVCSCAGSLIVNDNNYRTIWMVTNERHNTFVKEAFLKLFDIDSRDNTIGFFDTIGETNAKRFTASYGRRISDNIMIQLESARGRCPEPLIENIEYIISNAKILDE